MCWGDAWISSFGLVLGLGHWDHGLIHGGSRFSPVYKLVCYLILFALRVECLN